MSRKKQIWAIAFFLVIVLSFWLQRPKGVVFYDTFQYFSLPHHLRLSREVPKEKRERIWQEILSLLQELEHSFSYEKEDSEISRFNQLPPHQTMEVSERFAQLYRLSDDYFQQSEGYFDPTIYPLGGLWGFYEQNHHVPSLEEVATVRELVGMQHLIYQQKQGKHYLTKTKEERELNGKIYRQGLDFGGILKGYICDEVAKILQRHQISDALFQSGISSSLILGKQIIPILHPRSKQEMAQVNAKDIFISSSSDTQRFFTKNNRVYTHIFNPFNGQALLQRVHQISIFAKTGSESDVYASVCLLKRSCPHKNYVEIVDDRLQSRGVTFVNK